MLRWVWNANDGAAPHRERLGGTKSENHSYRALPCTGETRSR